MSTGGQLGTMKIFVIVLALLVYSRWLWCSPSRQSGSISSLTTLGWWVERACLQIVFCTSKWRIICCRKIGVKSLGHFQWCSGPTSGSMLKSDLWQCSGDHNAVSGIEPELTESKANARPPALSLCPEFRFFKGGIWKYELNVGQTFGGGCYFILLSDLEKEQKCYTKGCKVFAWHQLIWV